jgi:FtsZ-binding cell division protein ZapB
MSKAQWKQPALKQAEKKVADREQAIAEAKYWKQCYEELRDKNTFLTAERNEAKAQVNDLRGRAGAYEFLRREGVVLMSDEPKHLQGEDMDKYIERHTWNSLSGKAPNSGILRQIMDAQTLSSYSGGLRLRKQAVAVSVLDAAADNLQRHIDEHIKFKATGRYNIGSNTGIQSKEADQKDTGHHTDILRYADWYRVWEQRGS